MSAVLQMPLARTAGPLAVGWAMRLAGSKGAGVPPDSITPSQSVIDELTALAVQRGLTQQDISAERVMISAELLVSAGRRSMVRRRRGGERERGEGRGGDGGGGGRGEGGGGHSLS